jgi:hypothetical protein
MIDNQSIQTKLTCRERPGPVTFVLAVPLVLVLFILLMLGIRFATENLAGKAPVGLLVLLTLLVIIALSVGAALLLVFFTTRKVRVTPLMEVRVDINLPSWQVALIAFNFGLLGALFYALARETVGHRFVLCEEGVLVQRYFERWRSLHSYSADTTKSQIRLQRGRGRTVLLDLPKEQFDAAERIIASHLQQTR